uniref:MIF4G domain-containing protein n=1 Tax=Eutreptiella gymnastica TaxID=73025 RepID=A0A7S4LMH5_9EUGL
MSDDGPKTPPKQRIPTLSEAIEEDSWESWEDTDADTIQLATTPTKPSVLQSPKSPGPLKVYDLDYLLQFKPQPPNMRVKRMFPEPAPPKKEEKKIETDIRQDEKKDKKGKRPDTRMGFGHEPQAARDRPFANIGITSDNRPIVMDPDAALSSNPFMGQPQAGARPLFGTQVGGRGGSSKQQREQRALAKLERRVANPFKATKPESEMQATVKRVQGALNKITPEKYNELFQQMWEDLNEFNLYDVDDDDAMNVLDQVIGMIFEKALGEPSYSNMYADIARHLCDFATAVSQETGNRDAKPLQHFRKMLLDRCQTEFETRLVCLPDDPDERARLEAKHRKRSVGNIKFIAELFKRSMLTEKIMHDVIKNLLLGPPPHSEQHMPAAEELEVLCKLWSAAGQLLDRAEAVEYINYYFAIMSRHSQSYEDTRIRFMLVDIIDLRSNKWVPRRQQETAKTLSEIEDEFHGKGGGPAAPPPRLTPPGDAMRGRHAKDQAKGGAPTKASARTSNSRSPPPPTGGGQQKTGRGSRSSSPPLNTPLSPSSDRASPPVSPATPSGLPVDASVPGKGKQGSSKGQKGKDAKPKAKAQAPTAPKELSNEQMDGKVSWLIGEFAETQNTSEFVECLADLGNINHPSFVARAVYRVVESHKLSNERAVLACMLEVFLQPSEETERSVMKQRQLSLHKGIHLAIRDISEYELWVDSPLLWHDLCELLLALFTKGIVELGFLNTLFPAEFYNQYHDQAQNFILELFSQLKAKEAEWRCCTAFYRVLALMPAKHVPELIQALRAKDLIDTDVTLYVYSALKTQQPGEEILRWLQSRVSPEVVQRHRKVVCQKVVAAVLNYLTAEVASLTGNQAEESKLVAFESSTLASVQSMLRLHLTCEDTEMEIQLQVLVLDEVHRACVQFSFPKGHMARMFRLLYEAGVCSSFAFEDWIEGATDVPDKGKAIFEVNTFLQSLKSQHNDGDAAGNADEDAEDGEESEED